MPRISAKPILFSMTVLLALVGMRQTANARPIQNNVEGNTPTASSAPHENTDLATAVKAFNAKSLQNPLGKNESPLTEKEVLAAIRLAQRSDHAPASDALFASFKNIAQTHQLPAGAEFEVLTGLDPGGDFIFDVWYVRIMLQKEDGGTYSFTIREHVLRARPVAEEAKALEELLKKTPPMPGRYRLEDRLKELKNRAAKAAEKSALITFPESVVIQHGCYYTHNL